MLSMRNKGRLIKLGFLLFLMLILLFPSASFSGAKAGILLWWETLMPTLLPFMIISGIILRLRLTKAISMILYPIFKHLLPISKEGCYPVFIGFLAGVPIGAKTTADLIEQGSIGKKEAQMLCCISNNASPMFIISYVAASNLAAPKLAIPLLLILYSSSILSGLLWYHCSKSRISKEESVTAMEVSNCTNQGFQFALVDDAILSAFEVVTKVGGYVILFSVLASLIGMLPIPYPVVTAAFTAILEITTGIHNLSFLALSDNIKIVLITTVTAFGGLSGFAQTKSVLGSSGLSGYNYLITKLLSAAIAFILSTILVNIL